MQEEYVIRPVDREELIEIAIERQERMVADLEELQRAIKAIEKQVSRLEKDIETAERIIEQLRTGKIVVESHPARNRFVHMSIPDAAADTIHNLGRPLHVREFLEVLEAGGKRFDAVRPTVSIASALSRDARFVRVAPNTFDLIERTQRRLPIEE